MKNIFLALKNEIFNLKCVFSKLRTEVVPSCIQNGKNGKPELLLSGLYLSDSLVNSPAQKHPLDITHPNRLTSMAKCRSVAAVHCLEKELCNCAYCCIMAV